MTMHVSLPKELENLVHHHVKSGMYQSVSEVVREALRSFFSNKDGFTQDQIDWIRTEIGSRLKKVKAGKSNLIDGEKYFKSTIKRLSDKKS